MEQDPSSTTHRTKFESVHHPGERTLAAAYTQAMALPLGVCSLPVMLGGLAAALMERPILPALLWGFGFAFIVASLWTSFHLRKTVAEIRVRPDAAAVQSVYDCSAGRPLAWKRVFDVRQRGETVEASIGRNLYLLEPDEWPELQRLTEALEAARFDPYERSEKSEQT